MRYLACLLPLLATPVLAQEDPVIIQSTTSTQNSGLYEAILPQFEAATGIDAQVVAVGTGQALKNAQNCDGDILIVHAKPSEEEFVAAGYGVARHDLMYNDFIIIGPTADPAGVGAATSAADALGRFADAEVSFLSRGDDSGTHQAELALWEAAGLDAAQVAARLETGQGMGATLNMAAGMGAYTLSDRATWLAFENKADLAVLFEGDTALFNQYGVIVVSAEHCPNTNVAGAEALQEWLLGADGQAAIEGYTVDGEQLFFLNE